MKKFFITILLAIVAAGGVYYYTKDRSTSDGQDVWPANELSSAEHVSYAGQDGKNAFELLQTAAQVEFKQYDFGVFVESINGVKPDAQHFWKLYINGAESQVGADQLQTKNGDVVEWKLEEITQ